MTSSHWLGYHLNQFSCKNGLTIGSLKIMIHKPSGSFVSLEMSGRVHAIVGFCALLYAAHFGKYESCWHFG